MLTKRVTHWFGVVVSKKNILNKSIDESPKTSLLVGGAILAVVVLALLVTLTWYFLRFGKTP